MRVHPFASETVQKGLFNLRLRVVGSELMLLQRNRWYSTRDLNPEPTGYKPGAQPLSLWSMKGHLTTLRHDVRFPLMMVRYEAIECDLKCKLLNGHFLINTNLHYKVRQQAET